MWPEATSRAAEGHEEVGCGEGVFPSPRGGVWGGGCAPSPEIFSILDLKMASSVHCGTPVGDASPSPWILHCLVLETYVCDNIQ